MMDHSSSAGQNGLTLEISHCTSRAQLEAVVDLCDRAFPATDRGYFERHILRDATLRPEDTLIGTVEGRIVSSVQLFPRVCRAGGETLRFAGIGNVATDPRERGAGYAGMVMREALRRMTDGGFAFSLLTTTTVTAYYQKFGYRVLPRRAVNFDPPPDTDPECLIRPCEWARDGGRVKELYEGYNLGSAGTVVRDDLYWEAQRKFCGEDPAMFLVAVEHDSVVGYIRGGLKKGVLRLLEFAARPDRCRLFPPLLAAMSRQRPGATIHTLFSDREMQRLSPLPAHTLLPDTDAMLLVLDEQHRRTVEEMVLRPGAFMFWLSDSF
jgi:predicted N-acetyltransferase YhbS